MIDFTTEELSILEIALNQLGADERPNMQHYAFRARQLAIRLENERRFPTTPKQENHATIRGTAQVIPKVGDKGYYGVGSDIYPVTVVEIKKNGRQIIVRTVKFEGDKENGHDYYGRQVWKFNDDGTGNLITFNWAPRYNKWQNDGCRLHIKGEWHAYQDPSF